MGVMQVQLPDNLKQAIDRQIAEGRAASETDYVMDALGSYAEHLDAEDEIAAMVERADADLAAGRFVTAASAEDSQVLHENAMARLRVRLVENEPGR